MEGEREIPLKHPLGCRTECTFELFVAILVVLTASGYKLPVKTFVTEVKLQKKSFLVLTKF